jgi:hypothetical protein
MAGEFSALQKAVTRLVAAEVEWAKAQEGSQQSHHIHLLLEVENARSLYKYRLEKLANSLTKK